MTSQIGIYPSGDDVTYYQGYDNNHLIDYKTGDVTNATVNNQRNDVT